jgi:hypothetical protein
MTVWVQPPAVGGADTYTIVSNPSASEQATLRKDGYPSFATQAEAEAFVKARNGSFTLSTNPVKAIVQAATGNATAADQSKSAITDVEDSTGISSVADFLQGLTDANLWIRVAKVAVGGIMILIAVAKITGAESAISKIPVPIPV